MTAVLGDSTTSVMMTETEIFIHEVIATMMIAVLGGRMSPTAMTELREAKSDQNVSKGSVHPLIELNELRECQNDLSEWRGLKSNPGFRKLLSLRKQFEL